MKGDHLERQLSPSADPASAVRLSRVSSSSASAASSRSPTRSPSPARRTSATTLRGPALVPRREGSGPPLEVRGPPPRPLGPRLPPQLAGAALDRRPHVEVDALGVGGLGLGPAHRGAAARPVPSVSAPRPPEGERRWRGGCGGLRTAGTTEMEVLIVALPAAAVGEGRATSLDDGPFGGRRRTKGGGEAEWDSGDAYSPNLGSIEILIGLFFGLDGVPRPPGPGALEPSARVSKSRGEGRGRRRRVRVRPCSDLPMRGDGHVLGREVRRGCPRASG